MSDVRVERVAPIGPIGPSPTGDDEERVVARVESLLRAAGGSWRATVSPSAALSPFWVVEIARGEEGAAPRSVIFDIHAPRPEGPLEEAIAEIQASSSLLRAGPARPSAPPADRSYGEEP